MRTSSQKLSGSFLSFIFIYLLISSVSIIGHVQALRASSASVLGKLRIRVRLRSF